jgi:hypothetical protein
MDFSIILGVRGRPETTRRALESYERLTYKDYELWFMDDCFAGTNQHPVYEEFKDRLPIRYFPLIENFSSYIPDVTTWSPATTWNTGIRKAEGKFVIVTSADIIISDADALEKFLNQYNGNRISATTYFLPEEITYGTINTIDWKSDPRLIMTLPGFIEGNGGGRANYTPTPPNLLTFLTGTEKSKWEEIGCFRTQLSHLVNDQDLYLRELFLGKNTDTWEGCVALHQAHPRGEAHVSVTKPGWHYETERQARLIDEAPRDET